jgi:hypothetical protein
MQRINWIDWAKALAVMAVVFCHLPQSQEWFYYRYLQATIIVIFFWISGYLKKDRGCTKENWKKYWQGLILPYILWNVIVYPYWFIKYYMLNEGMPDIMSAFKPVFGAILLQHENAFCEPLNGPLWYIPAIIILHVTADICHKSKFEHTIWGVLIILSIILYAANKYWYFVPNLTPMGLMRNLPFYYIGYYMGRKAIYKEVEPRRDFAICFICMPLSIYLFQIHLQEFFAGRHLLHITFFYPLYVSFMFGVLSFFKLLEILQKKSSVINSFESKIIKPISIGTLLIIGIHVPIISIINILIKHVFNLPHAICYQWHEALFLTFVIMALLYPLILFCQNHFPILFGRKKTVNYEHS